MPEKVAVLGASRKPDRYSYKATEALLQHGHEVLPISPNGDDILDQKGYKSYSDIDSDIDTLTIYVNSERLAPLLDDILAAPPKRAIFNPGTESPDAEKRLEDAGVEVLEACTLVLLGTGQY